MARLGTPSTALAEHAVSRISMREVFIDFMAGLVPGMVFILTAAAVLGCALASAAVAYLGSDGVAPSTIVRSADSLSNAFGIEMFLLMVMLSYLVGNAFHRQDLKPVDKKSFERHFFGWRFGLRGWWRRRTKQAERLEARARGSLEHWVAASKDECEYPYPRLRRYLRDRGLHHLARMVPWTGEQAAGSAASDDLPVQRTKQFIHILKIRLTHYHPEKCATISRNEAHVRMLGATWYMARQLRLPVGIAFAVALASLLSVLGWRPARPLSIPAIPNPETNAVAVAVFTLSVAAALGIGCWLTARAIEKTLHYHRVQEIVWLLETSYTAFRDHPETLRDLCPDYAGGLACEPSEPERVRVHALAAEPAIEGAVHPL